MSAPPPPSDRDWDAEFDAITRHLRPTPGTPLGDSEVRPATRHTFEHGFDTGDDEQVPATPPTRPDDSPGEPGAFVADPVRDPALDVDDFVPPEPRPVDVGDPATVVMLGCLALGPLWLLYLLFFDRTAATLWWGTALAVTGAGFVMVVARQPKSRDEDDDDDGARV